MWGAEGKDTATLDAFFDQLGSDRAAGIETVSMDMGASFNKSVRAEGHARKAVICIDPFHGRQARPPTPWTPCAGRPATSCAHCPTRPRPRSSRDGFHSAKAALALVMLSCGPIELLLPHERSPG